MSALEKPFIDAIAAKKINGAILEGKDASGARYGFALGTRTLLDGTETPLSSNDILFLASSTKVFATIAVLQCCERGKLSLDEDLRQRFPAVAELRVLISYDGPDHQPVFEPLRKPLTLRHLLTHSSGFVYDGLDCDNPMMARWFNDHPCPKVSPAVLTRFPGPLAFQPGDEWTYGPGVDWAGWAVEQTTELRLDEHIRTHILQPLGIDESGFSFFPVKKGWGARMADLNPKDPLGCGFQVSSGHNVHGENPSNCFGGHGGYATAPAFVSVLHSLLANDGKILSPEMVREMSRPQLEPQARDSLRAKFQTDDWNVMTQPSAGPGRDFGLGGVLIEDDDDPYLGKGALLWGGGISTAWLLDPTNGFCGFVSPQLGIPWNSETALHLKAAFRAGLRNQLAEVRSKP